MTTDDEIPGHRVIVDWPTQPTAPLHLIAVERVRDGTIPRGTVVVELADADGKRFTFFFDGFLGRLCFGSDPGAEDAAFVGKGSQLQRDLFRLLPTLVGPADAVATLRECLDHAATWT